MRSYHNIESLKLFSKARTFLYVGYAANGTKYYATRYSDGKSWRFALVTSRTGLPDYFYARTLSGASAKLESLGA